MTSDLSCPSGLSSPSCVHISLAFLRLSCLFLSLGPILCILPRLSLLSIWTYLMRCWYGEEVMVDGDSAKIQVTKSSGSAVHQNGKGEWEGGTTDILLFFFLFDFVFCISCRRQLASLSLLFFSFFFNFWK